MDESESGIEQIGGRRNLGLYFPTFYFQMFKSSFPWSPHVNPQIEKKKCVLGREIQFQNTSSIPYFSAHTFPPSCCSYALDYIESKATTGMEPVV